MERKKTTDKFLSEDGKDMRSDELLAYLLTFAGVKEADTTAKDLIACYGSFSAVLDTPYAHLLAHPALREHSAILIKLFSAVSGRYLRDKYEEKILPDMDAIGNYLVRRYFGIGVETVFLLMLDEKDRIIDCVKMHEGSINSASITLRRLVETALRANAKKVVLSHNHPSGRPIPSKDDIYTTEEVQKAFSFMEMEMLGHILVAGEHFINILDHMEA